MKQTLGFIVFLGLFVSIGGFLFYDEYRDFHARIIEEESSKESINRQLEEFSSPSVSSLSGQLDLSITPDTALLDELVEQIDNAKKEILVEVYIFTERSLRDAIIRAHQRGVNVRVLLENNPYMSPYLNDNHYETFQEAGVPVVWSDPLHYSLNHGKILIIDDYAYVSTGNFSASLFTKNKDFLLRVADPAIVSSLRDTFFHDYNSEYQTDYHPNLVISPQFSRQKIESLIETSQHQIDFYFPYIDDPSMQERVLQKAQSGVRVRGIVEKDFYSEHPEVITSFSDAGATIHPLQKHKLHAKAILFDQKILYIGSINFSTYSFDENREIGILIVDPEIIGEFTTLFNSDF